MAQVIFETETKMALWGLDSRIDTARRHAVTRLSAHSETGAGALAELLRDPDPEVRTLAAIRLDSMIFPPAVPGWIDLLVDKDDSLRERAVISLGAIGDPVAIDGLTSVLLNDPNPDVRRQAARSLGLIAAGN
jgi:HEAT repeat protein